MNSNDIRRQVEESIALGEPRTRIEKLNLAGEIVPGPHLAFCDWVLCNMRNAVIADADCRGSDFSTSDVRGLRFYRCETRGCIFTPAQRRQIKLIDCEQAPPRKAVTARSSASAGDRIDRVLAAMVDMPTDRLHGYTMLIFAVALLLMIFK